MSGISPTGPACYSAQDVNMEASDVFYDAREPSVTYRAGDFAKIFINTNRFTLPPHHTLTITRVKRLTNETYTVDLEKILNAWLRLKGKAITNISSSRDCRGVSNEHEGYLNINISSGAGEFVIEADRFRECFASLADIYEQLKEPNNELQFTPEQRLIVDDFDESIVNEIFSDPSPGNETLFEHLDSKLPDGWSADWDLFHYSRSNRADEANLLSLRDGERGLRLRLLLRP